MSAAKEKNVSFPEQGKETIQDRLKKLMAGRSLRKVSQDWGFPYSTLNNYFAKGTMPGVDVVTRVAHVENVPVEWLVLGTDAELDADLEARHPKLENPPTSPNDDFQGLRVIWESLTRAERAQLTRLLGRRGADVLTLLLDEEALKLLTLTGDVRQAALALEKLPESRLREILVECREIQQDPTLNVQHKQAG